MKRSALTCFIGFVISIIAVTSTPAHGQGTFGSLPDPISSRELDTYAERLGLSSQQLQAIADSHTSYLNEFRVLREGDVERFIQFVQALGNDFDFSKRREVEQAVRTHGRLMLRVRALDEQLFDEMQAVLTDEQIARLPRVRLERERRRHSSDITRGVDMLNPAARVDLSEMIHDLRLPPDVMQLADPILETYERRFTVGVKKLFDATATMILETLKRLEAEGFTDGSPRDPGMAMRLFSTFQEIWADISAELLEDAADLASINRNTYRNLANVLPNEVVVELRNRYYRRAYPEAATIGRTAQRQLDAALRLELPDDLHESVEMMAVAHWQSQDRIATQIVNLLDEHRKGLSIQDMMRMGSADQRQEQIDQLRTRADAADERILETLHAMLGPELTAQVQSARVQRDAPSWGTAATGARRFSRSSSESDSEAQQPLGQVPHRISPRDLAAFATALGLDANQQVLLEGVHDEYLSRFRAVNDEYLAPLRAAAQDLASVNEGYRDSSVQHAEQVDEVFRLHRAAFDAIRQLDEGFFDDVQLVVIQPEQTDALSRLRLQRERAGYIASGSWSGEAGPWSTGVAEATIDVSALLDNLRVTVSAELANDVLVDYEREITSLFRDKYNAELEVYRAFQTMTAARDGGNSFRNIMRSAGRTAQQTSRQIASLNRATLDALRSRLPENAAYELVHVYRQQAFPQVSEDDGAAEPMINAAMELPGLAEGQRSRLRDLAGDYRMSYARVSEQMFVVYEAMSSNTSQRRRDNAEAYNELARLRFERDEINERTKRQLRAILNDDQMQRLGAM